MKMALVFAQKLQQKLQKKGIKIKEVLLNIMEDHIKKVKNKYT